MKFNSKDLGPISAHWGSTFEGVLLLKQRSEHVFRRSNTFCEYWCRLKGNLLVLLKNCGVKSVDLVGVILLEKCTAKPVTNADIQNAFQIEFDYGDQPILLAARSAEEAKVWCCHILAAGISEISARKAQVRSELREITGKDPLDQFCISTESNQPSYDEFSETGLELQLSLLHENSVIVQNSDQGLRIKVYAREPVTGTSWNMIGETETQMSTCSAFLKTVKISSERVSESSLIRLTLVQSKDHWSTSPGREIGSIVIKAETFYRSSSLKLPIPIQSDSSPETPGKKCLLMVQVLNRSSSALSFEHLDIQSQQLHNICDNILTRNYVFPHTLGVNMRVVEFMGESRFCFYFPTEYLKSLITQEHLLYDSLLRVGMSDPTLECLRKERLMGMKNLIERYELCLRSTVDHNGPSFKRSTERKCAELDFVPTNLHANRIGLLDPDNKFISHHDIISVGAFTCTEIKFKSKGLFKVLANYSDGIGSGSVASSAAATVRPVADLLETSPFAAVVLQSERNPIGRALHHLSTGAVIVVRMSGDLTELNSRLRAHGQASVLARRMEKSMDALMRICKGIFVDDSKLQSLHESYKTLLHLIMKLSALDTLESAPQSEPKESAEKEDALAAIVMASGHLQKVLLRTWEWMEENLWRQVLSSLAAVASKEMSSSSTATNLQLVSNVLDSVHYRHHAALSQVLTAALTGLSLAMANWTSPEWKQMVRCGVPLYFEGLLSCYGEEVGMLENWVWAVQCLAFCRVVIRPDSSPQTADNSEEKEGNETQTGGSPDPVRILGFNEILLKAPRSVWARAPAELQARGRISLWLHPFYFNAGINEQQTLAERLERTNLQVQINKNGLESLQSYFEKYTRKFGAPRRTPTQQDVCDVISSLHYTLETTRSKPVEALQLAQDISYALNALRFTSCKSAKDRTGMAISLEQVRWLAEVEGLDKDSFSPALKCLRSTGLRLANAEKNILQKKYSFTHLQLLSFPKAYRPPMGTYAVNVQS